MGEIPQIDRGDAGPGFESVEEHLSPEARAYLGLADDKVETPQDPADPDDVMHNRISDRRIIEGL